MLSVTKETLKPPRAGRCLAQSPEKGAGECLTGVYRSDSTLHNDGRKAVKTGQGSNDLLKGRQLRNHVEKQGDEPVLLSDFCYVSIIFKDGILTS